MSFTTPLISGVVSEGCTVRSRGARGANLGAGLSLAEGIRGRGVARVRIATRLPVAVAARLDRLAASRFAGNRTRAVVFAVERATAPELEAVMGAASDSVAGLAETLELLSASARAGSVTAQRELLSLHERLVAAGESDDGS
jgi:hypothetical protein